MYRYTVLRQSRRAQILYKHESTECAAEGKTASYAPGCRHDIKLRNPPSAPSSDALRKEQDMFVKIVKRALSRKRLGLEIVKLYICAAVLIVAYAYNFCEGDPYTAFDCFCCAVGIAGAGVGGCIAVEQIRKLLKK